MSSGTSLSLPDGLFAPYELVRKLGNRPNPLYALRQSGTGIGGKPALAVAERFVGCAEVGAGGEDLGHDARRIATLASPNLARVREVLVRGPDLVLVGELVDGEKLQEVWRPEKLPLEIALRIIVDALAGVGALHNLRDSRQEPMKLAHGELSPATIVIGVDGIARVLHAVSRRAPGAKADVASYRYLSPEVASGDSYDARADVFSAGVLLWEALSGKPLFVQHDPQANAARVRSGALPVATVPAKAAWAKGLVDVAAKALSASPDARWPTATVMAAELRKAAGLKLAPASTAAAFARSAFGERVKTRRESLETTSPRSLAPEPPGPAPEPPTSAPEPPKPAPEPPKPPPEPRSLPEPSFLDVELHSAVEMVLVAPGLRAPVEEVVELGSDVLVESSRPSSIPPAAATAGRGFVLDPFAGPVGVGQPAPPPEGLRFTPPSAPAVAVAPVVVVQGPPIATEAPPPSITGSPHFAAAIDPFPPAFPLAAPVASVPVFEAPAAELRAEPGGGRRRKIVVLGGVVGLGIVIFVLVAIRLVQREPEATPARLAPPPLAASALALPPPALSTASPPPPAPPPAPPPPSSTVAAAPPASTAPPVVVAPAPRPTPVSAIATPTPVPATRAPAPFKPRPKPTFDPNTL